MNIKISIESDSKRVIISTLIITVYAFTRYLIRKQIKAVLKELSNVFS